MSVHKHRFHRKDAKNAKCFKVSLTRFVIPAKAGIQFVQDQ